MLSLSDNNKADVIDAFNIPQDIYVDYLLNIDNPYFEQMVDQIYLTEISLRLKPRFGLGLVHNEWHSCIENL